MNLQSRFMTTCVRRGVRPNEPDTLVDVSTGLHRVLNLAPVQVSSPVLMPEVQVAEEPLRILKHHLLNAG